MQEIGSALRMGSGGENRPLVAFEDFQPVFNVGGVIAARFGREYEIGAEESGG